MITPKRARSGSVGCGPMAPRNLPSPYAPLVGGTPVRRDSVALRGGTAALWHYGPARDGTGPHVLVLHGFRGDHHGLEPIVAHLLGDHPEIRVTVPDLPGFGESPPLSGIRHDVAGYAAWTRDLLRVLAPDGDIVLAGHSFGSVVAAAALAAGAPAGTPTARRLVLINPIPRPPLSGTGAVSVGSTAVLHRLAGALPEAAGTWILRHPVLTRVASLAMVRTPDRALRRWIHEEHDRYFAGFSARKTLLEAFEASITRSVRESAREIRVPTLLIGGEKDDLARVEHQKSLANLFPDARLTLIPGVGHLTHYETPGEVADRVAPFLVPPPAETPVTDAPAPHLPA